LTIVSFSFENWLFLLYSYLMVCVQLFLSSGFL
jgi:hypothetical protein